METNKIRKENREPEDFNYRMVLEYVAINGINALMCLAKKEEVKPKLDLEIMAYGCNLHLLQQNINLERIRLPD